jgi:hypothetical protein
MMRTALALNILRQPTEETCGPTCLQSVYTYYGDIVALEEVIAEVPTLPDGGTLAVHLACHALSRGYRATIYTYNLQVFDPSWFKNAGTQLHSKILTQSAIKSNEKIQEATRAYLKFLDLGGDIRFEDLTPSLLKSFLMRSTPVITGLSATYLYQTPRELVDRPAYDDIAGEPAGHFVVIGGFDSDSGKALIADPYIIPDLNDSHVYEVSLSRLICSILLGIVTFDANLLVIRPAGSGNQRHA